MPHLILILYCVVYVWVFYFELVYLASIIFIAYVMEKKFKQITLNNEKGYNNDQLVLKFDFSSFELKLQKICHSVLKAFKLISST